MKTFYLAALLAALAASPAFADTDILGHEVPVKKQKEDPPPVLPGLSGEAKATAPQNSAEGDASASVKAAPAAQMPPATDAAMFESQKKSAGGKPPPVEKPAEDAPKKKPEGR